MLSILAGVKLEARWGKDKIRTAAMEPTEDSSPSFFPHNTKANNTNENKHSWYHFC